jgi:hypothetical protein
MGPAYDASELDGRFRAARAQTEAYVEKFNAALPTDHCPQCHAEGHCPGLPCPTCGYRHEVSWLIVLDTEWGYAAVALNDRRVVVAEFKV